MRRLHAKLLVVGYHILLWLAYLPLAIQMVVHKLPSCHWLPLRMWLRWIDIRLAVLLPARKLGIRMIDMAVALYEQADALLTTPIR